MRTEKESKDSHPVSGKVRGPPCSSSSLTTGSWLLLALRDCTCSETVCTTAVSTVAAGTKKKQEKDRERQRSERKREEKEEGIKFKRRGEVIE